jgi:phenylalanyl-tRNA synthetase beta chain
VQLICELAGGVATEDVIDVYPQLLEPRTIYLRPHRVQDLTSLSVPREDVVRILTGLQFEVKEVGERLLCRVPSWRIDVEQEEDLIEEVARHTGFDKIGSDLPPSSASGEYQPTEMKQRLLRRAFNAFGFDEAINFSFIERETQFVPIFSLEAEAESDQPLLKNPIIEEAAFMRATLLPGLLNSLRHNLNHGLRDIRLFEVGRVFAPTLPGELPAEGLALGAVATGGASEANKAQAEREFDFFDVKGALETAVDWMTLSPLSFKQTSARHLRSGQAALIKLNDGTAIGTIGRLAESVAANYKFRSPVYVMELDLGALLSGPARVVQYSVLPRYPSVVRDISLLLNRSIALDEIVTVVTEKQIADFRDVKLVGTFEGGNIPSAKRSVTLRLEYRSDERTLRDEEVEERHARLTSALLETFGAEQR